MSKTKLRVRDGEAGIPVAFPSLMPFHIAYSGPAPISTYFLTQPFIDADEKRRRLAGESVHNGDTDTESHVDNAMDTLIGESRGIKDALEDRKDALAGQPVVGSETNTRLVAAFRGRRVVSHEVLLPEGYTGLLLTSSSGTKLTAENTKEDDNSGKTQKKAVIIKPGDRGKALKAKVAAKSKASGKGTWRSRKVIEEDAEEGLAEEDELEPEDEFVKPEGDSAEVGEGAAGSELVEDEVFEIAGKFQRFTLWHPDAPVDEGRDEYTRSLKEWIALAGEIHRV